MLGRGMNATSSSLTSFKDREPIKGYRFHPTDEELINHHLQKKILGYDNLVIAEVDICKHEPWDLPGLSKLPSNDYTWYFLSPPDYKFRNSKQVNRTTKDGYWKVTSQKRIIKKRGTNETIGIKKILVFYRGRVPDGVKTSWVIHEFSQNFSSSNGRDFVLCRLRQKSHNKIDNSTIDKGESSHDATSGVEKPVTEIVVTEMDLQYLEEILSSNEEYVNPRDAQQPDMCMEHGPPGGNLENVNSFTNNYNVPLSPFGTSDLQDNTTKWNNYNVPLSLFGTSDLQDNTTKWINSSTANQDACSIDGSMPTLPNDSSPSVSFGNLPIDDIGDTEEVDKWLNSYVESAFGGYSLSNTLEYFNPPDAQQPDMCMEHGLPVGNLQNVNNFTNNYNVPLSPFGTSDLQDNTTKWINSSTANQDVCSIDGSMPTLPNDFSPSVSFGNLPVDDIGDTEEVDKWLNSYVESAFGGYSLSNT